jgi:hypothetical protein
MTTEQMVTLLVMILGLITAVVYVAKGYFEWDTARLKHSLQKKRDENEEEE